MVPSVVGIAAWGGAGRWQAGREDSRERAALAALSDATLDSEADRARIVRELAALGVEAQLGPTIADAKAAPDIPANKFALAGKPVVETALFDSPEASVGWRATAPRT